MVHFHAGQHFDIQPVDFRAMHVHPPDAGHRRGDAQVPWLWRRGRSCSIHAVQVADARDQAHVVRTSFIGGAGRREHVAVAGRVDHHLGQNRLASRLALEHGALHLIPVDDGIDAPAVQQYLDPRLLDHLDHEILHRLGIDGGC